MTNKINAINQNIYLNAFNIFIQLSVRIMQNMDFIQTIRVQSL